MLSFPLARTHACTVRTLYSVLRHSNACASSATSARPEPSVLVLLVLLLLSFSCSHALYPPAITYRILLYVRKAV